MTAAAVTGPARQPRPASSVPVSNKKDEKLSESMECVLNTKIIDAQEFTKDLKYFILVFIQLK